MASRKFRYAFWGELVTLAAAALVFVLPFKIGSHPFGLPAERSVDLYYALSLTAIIAAQVAYMWPLRSFRVANYKWLAGSVLATLIVILFWWSRAEGRRIDFSELESGEIFGPLLFALTLPMFHALAVLISGAALDPAKPRAAQPNLPAK